jgi:hypothetical protein
MNTRVFDLLQPDQKAQFETYTKQYNYDPKIMADYIEYDIQYVSNSDHILAIVTGVDWNNYNRHNPEQEVMI